MNPAFSVILFTTLSGAGFGLWFWIALRIAFGNPPEGFTSVGWLFGLLLGGAFVAGGVIASLWHLGKPARVWRAFSQWRSSWMSREGVFAIAAFVVAAALCAILSGEITSVGEITAMRILATALIPLCFAAVFSTAMIYASLKPIPAWRHRLVVPAYLLFALLGGGIWFLIFGGDTRDSPIIAYAVIITAVLLFSIKLRYWRDLDRDALPHTRGDAVGLPERKLSAFERPHTEENFLTREMGFALARKHSRVLRRISSLLFAVNPVICVCFAWAFPHAPHSIICAVAALSMLAGTLVERWLFFAEAKHLVTLYY